MRKNKSENKLADTKSTSKKGKKEPLFIIDKNYNKVPMLMNVTTVICIIIVIACAIFLVKENRDKNINKQNVEHNCRMCDHIRCSFINDQEDMYDLCLRRHNHN